MAEEFAIITGASAARPGANPRSIESRLSTFEGIDRLLAFAPAER